MQWNGKFIKPEGEKAYLPSVQSWNSQNLVVKNEFKSKNTQYLHKTVKQKKMISWNLQSPNIFVGKPTGHTAYTIYVNKYGIIRVFKKGFFQVNEYAKPLNSQNGCKERSESGNHPRAPMKHVCPDNYLD